MLQSFLMTFFALCLRSDELSGTRYTTMLVGKVRSSGEEAQQQQGRMVAA